MRRYVLPALLTVLLVGSLVWYSGNLTSWRTAEDAKSGQAIPATTIPLDKGLAPGPIRLSQQASPGIARPEADRRPASSASLTRKVEADATTSGALFWFNWKEMSERGDHFYGASVYQRLLPLLAPGSKCRPTGWVVLFDGDILSDLPQINASTALEVRCMADVRQIGPKNCYVVAMFGAGVPYDDIDMALRASGAPSYLGKTACPGLDAEGFVALTRKLALPVALRIEGTLFKKIGFDFLSDEKLRALGYNPVQARR